MHTLFLFILSLFLFVTPVFAKYDPTTVANNKYGIHIVDINDVADAATLVNSNGGNWGYVTLVMQEDDRNKDKWQHTFDDLRRLHLIPIVRLATHVDGASWVIPSAASANDWAQFLNDLNWPIENRYVVLFNEPNHADEWGGKLDPSGFADITDVFTQTLHKANTDFFILPGALDVSASSDGASMDAAAYWSQMFSHNAHVFDDVDGWASHSYPNPAFSGSPYATGRGTLYSYFWERNVLKNLGFTKKLPVFITETGWQHSEGATNGYGLLSSQQVGQYLTVAAQTVWQDPDIVAITPFVLNYQAFPFDHFSWRLLGQQNFYPQFASYQNIQKSAGDPKQHERFIVHKKIIPTHVVSGSTYTVSGTITNAGQSILSSDDGYVLKFTVKGNFASIYDPLPVLEPTQTGQITIHIETPKQTGDYPYTLELSHGNQTAVLETGSVKVVEPPSVTVSVQLGWRKTSDATDASILVYDDKTLLSKVNGVHISNGKGTITGLRNILPGKRYRIVVLAPYYLPRQAIATLSANNTSVTLPRMYPLDFNKDGALTPADILAGVQLKPNFIFSLIVSP